MQQYLGSLLPLQNDAVGAALSLFFLLVALAVVVATVAGQWRVFEKAGRAGWAVLVPFYNQYVTLKIGGNSGWWMLALFVPLLNVLVLFKMFVDVARRFDRGIGYGLGLALLPFVFFPVLGFGDYAYRPEAGTVHEEWTRPGGVRASRPGND